MDPPREWKYAFIIFIIIVIIVFITKLFQYFFTQQQQQQFLLLDENHSIQQQDPIQFILKESARYDALSKQDQNIAYALMHINYAIAYANVLRQITNDQEIQNKTGITMSAFIQNLQENQQMLLQSLGQQCPNILPNNTFAIATGWLA